MDKRHLHHLWTKIRRLTTWHLLVLALVSSVVCAFALRNNNMTMVHLRDAVYQADQNNGNVEQALQNLRAHVQAHMNTDLSNGATAVYPPIQLKYTYERLQQAERQRADTASTLLYTQAQQTCEALYPGSFSGGPRIPCIEQYVAQHAVKPNPIPDSLYKFSFMSPRWSPDLAGWSLVATIILFVFAMVRFLMGRWVKRNL